MTDSISRALERARELNRGRFGAASKRRPTDDVCPGARPIDVSPQVLEAHRLIGGIDDQRAVDAYSLLRARILHRVLQRDYKTLGVTSASAREGKSLTAANLAISIALGETHPVLLVDADIRRPSLATLFGLKVEAGLGDYLAGDVALEDVVLKLPIDGLFMLPGRTGCALRPESLSAGKLFQLVLSLKQLLPSGLVVFDLSPALIGGDVISFAPNLDAVLLVIADRRTNEQALAKTLPLLEGANIIGTVLNFADDIMTSDDYYSGR
jgi:Mrp family chromosome partitioning ATPase